MITLCWCAASFTFNLLIFFVKYMPGDIYFNNILASMSAFSLLIQGKLEKLLNAKGGQVISFLIALIFSGTLMLFDADTN